MDKLNISVVIPVYNSQKTIEKTVERTTKVLSEYDKINQYEIILVNDGSKDESDAVCRKLALLPYVCYTNFTKNFGQHHALLCGFKQATGDIIVKVDDDLQILPSEIPAMVDALIDKNADVAFGDYVNKKHSPFRNWGSKLNNKMAQSLLEKPKSLKVSSFYIMKDYVAKNIVAYENPYPYIAGLIFKATDNIINVSVKHAERKEGTSNYTLKKLIKLWLNGFVNFSVKPLRIATLLGSILCVLGFIFLIALVIKRMLDSDVQLGWTSIMAAVVFFGGVQLLSIGLIGEYVGRIFISINKFPQYVIKDKVDGRKK